MYGNPNVLPSKWSAFEMFGNRNVQHPNSTYIDIVGYRNVQPLTCTAISYSSELEDYLALEWTVGQGEGGRVSF